MPPGHDAAPKSGSRRALHALGLAALVVVGTGGIPGERTRAPHAVTPPLAAAVAEGDGTIRDATVDVTVRAPLPAARVQVFAIAGDRAYPVGAAETDAGGRAHFASLPRGEAWIVADAPGRARATSHLALDAAPRSVTLDLGPEHPLEVAVKDDLGAAVAGADLEVLATGDPLPVGARTGADGRAHVGRLGEGPWNVTVRAPGYEEEVHGAREGEPLAVVLRKLGAIAVHVAGEDGAAAAGARVAIAGATLWPPRVAVADAAGDVRIASLEAGTYALRASRGDAVSAIELGAALGRGEQKELALKLARGRFVTVRVTDGDAEDADPIASARVTVAEGGLSPFPLEATTDRAGRATLGPIAPGGAALSAHADGFVARGAVAVADPPPPETRVSLTRSGVLTGRVVDARGRPVDGATLSTTGTDPSGQPVLEDPRRARFRAAHFDAMLAGPAPLLSGGDLGVVPGPVPPVPSTPSGALAAWSQAGAALAARDTPAEPWVTREDGTFRLAPASPGRLRVVVRHPEYVEAESDLVTLAPGGSAQVDVVLHEGGALEGRVVDAHERPVERARVFVRAVAGDADRSALTATDGTFAFAALPSAVLLTVATGDTESPDARLAITVPEGGRKEVTVTLPEPRDALPVAVVDAQGFPIDAAQVTASSLAPDAYLRATSFTDAHGETRVARARGLPLRVEVRAPSRAPRVVTTDGTEEALRVELAPAERAAGEVVAARGHDPVAGATVTLYTDLGPRRTRTDAHGVFALPELPPGAARVSVRATGFAPAALAVTVPDSGGRRAFAMPSIELAAEGVVEGEVVDAHGDPVAGARVARDAVPTWVLVGANPEGVAVTDAEGKFALHELPEGALDLEAYAAGVGRGRASAIVVNAGRTTDGVRIVAGADDAPARASEPAGRGGVAVTLGETAVPIEVVVASVVERSEAERAGLVPGDVLVSVDGSPVATMEAARARLNGPIGEDVVLGVRRGDREFALRVAREAVRR